MKPEHLEVTPQAHTFFITSNTSQGTSVFQVEQWARIFLKNLYHCRREGNYLLHEFVLMPNHFHLLITPIGETSLEKAMQFIKGGSAFQLKQAGRTKSGVWQRGFTDRRVRDAEEYQGCREYIYQNAVKAGLVQVLLSVSGLEARSAAALPQRLKPTYRQLFGTAEAVPFPAFAHRVHVGW